MHRAFAAVVVALTLCCGSVATVLGAGLAAPGDPASAPLAASAGAHDAEARAALKALEARFAALLAQQQVAQRDVEALRARLRDAQARTDGLVVYGLSTLALLLLAVVAFLLWRLARLRAEHAWLHDSQSLAAAGRMAPGGPPDFDEVTASSMRVVGDTSDDAASAPVPPRPGSVPTTVAAAARVRRELTAEELFDLEQQADFFIAIGQEESAIDLLMAHVRSTGGTGPMPYIKLLSIYRRRDEPRAYERVRERFNRRFNANVPAWTADPAAGRPLEDYPDVMERVQRAWPEPRRAMDLLQALLFRRDPAQEGFELPAYEDLLCLYAVARDRLDVASSPEGVDLLLPLEPPDAPTAIEKGALRPPDAGPGVDVELDLGPPTAPRPPRAT